MWEVLEASPRNGAHHFHLYSSDQNSTTWPHLTLRQMENTAQWCARVKERNMYIGEP